VDSDIEGGHILHAPLGIFNNIYIYIYKILKIQIIFY